MRRIDYWTGREFQLPPLIIMENAGRTLAQLVVERFAPSKKDLVLVLAGSGINGGAVLAAGRMLAHRGHSGMAWMTEVSSKLDPDVRRQVTMFRREGGTAPAYKPDAIVPSNAIILDGLLGYSLGENLKGATRTFIELANAHASPKVALDIPSGLNPDTGKVRDIAVNATATLAVGFPKAGLFEGEGPAHAGEVYLGDVGYPRELYADFDLTPESLFGDSGIVRLDQ